jgi:ABC-type transporter Mla maintaining outer membrane lipid asymmetry permease subunit MlaE
MEMIMIIKKMTLFTVMIGAMIALSFDAKGSICSKLIVPTVIGGVIGCTAGASLGVIIGIVGGSVEGMKLVEKNYKPGMCTKITAKEADICFAKAGIGAINGLRSAISGFKAGTTIGLLYALASY